MPRPADIDDAPLRSCFYEARVMHHRLEPRRHRFEYGIFLACLDLDELDRLDARSRWFSRNRRNWLEFRDADHLPHPDGTPGTPGIPGTPGDADPRPDTRRSLAAWLARNGVTLAETDRVLLLTLPRIAGYVFNPVSFYFCTRAGGEPVCAVAEVGNTFGELKPYLVPLKPGGRDGGVFRLVAPKHYYVSPFTALDVCFDFQLRMPGAGLRIAVNDVHDGRNLLVTTLTGTRRPFTDAEAMRLALRHPLVTVKVITAIHWHALRLWLKRVPWHAKSGRPDLQRGVFRPHASIVPRSAGSR